MKKSRRRAGWLVGLMVAVSLVMAPRGGAAWGPVRWPEPGPPNEGDPDEPYSHRPTTTLGIEWRWKDFMDQIERRFQKAHVEAYVALGKLTGAGQRRAGVVQEGKRR